MLSRHTRFVTEDQEEAAEFVSRLLDRRMGIQPHGPFRLSIETTTLDLLTIVSVESTATLSSRVSSDNRYTLTRVEDGSLERSWEDFVVEADAGQGILTTPQKEIISKAPPNCLTAISISPTNVELEAAQMIGDQVVGPLEILQPLELRGSLLGQKIDYLLIEMGRNAGGLVWDEQFGLLRVDFQRRFIEALIDHPASSYQPLLTKHFGGNARRHVALLKEFLYANLRNPITLSDMTHALGISLSTLLDSCRRVPPFMPPHALWLDLRLEAACKAFAFPQPEDTVGSIALRYCFYNPGRFAKYYERKYGETPHEALQHGRRRNGAAP